MIQKNPPSDTRFRSRGSLTPAVIDLLRGWSGLDIHARDAGYHLIPASIALLHHGGELLRRWGDELQREASYLGYLDDPSDDQFPLWPSEQGGNDYY